MLVYNQKLKVSSRKMYELNLMLNENTLGVKMCEANKKQPYLCATKALISAEAKKSPIKDVLNHSNDIL